MNTTTALAGATVLVTRPAAQARGLCAAIAEAGGTPLPLPLQRIAAIDTPELRECLRRSADAAWWIFTSVNAVEAAAKLLPPPWRPQLAAVGARTAATLRALGQVQVLAPRKDFSGAALLALAPLRALASTRVLLVTGAEGRAELPQALRERGAQLEVAALYRRVPVEHSTAAIAAAVIAADAAVVANAGALTRLFESTCDRAHEHLLRLQLAVPSPRVVELAAQYGFREPPLLPHAVSDAAFARCLAHWWQRRLSP